LVAGFLAGAAALVAAFFAGAGALAAAFFGAVFFTDLGAVFVAAGFFGAAFFKVGLLFVFAAGLAVLAGTGLLFDFTDLTGACFAGLAAGFLTAGFLDFAGMTLAVLGCR
jgi:hypothetical protein